MGTVLTYGLTRPDAGDESKSEWMPNERANITHIDGHNHDGSNSALVNMSTVAKTPQDILQANWTLVTGTNGLYRQQVTMPAALTYDNAFMKFNYEGGSSDKDEVFLTTEKSGASSYWVYINDNSIDLIVRYI